MNFGELKGSTDTSRHGMWTKKNNKGAKITRKMPILQGTVSTDKEEVLEMEEYSGDPDVPLLLEEISYHLTPLQQNIVTSVVQDPTLIKPNGKLNIKQISEAAEVTWF